MNLEPCYVNFCFKLTSLVLFCEKGLTVYPSEYHQKYTISDALKIGKIIPCFKSGHYRTSRRSLVWLEPPESPKCKWVHSLLRKKKKLSWGRRWNWSFVNLAELRHCGRCCCSCQLTPGKNSPSRVFSSHVCLPWMVNERITLNAWLHFARHAKIFLDNDRIRSVAYLLKKFVHLAAQITGRVVG